MRAPSPLPFIYHLCSLNQICPPLGKNNPHHHVLAKTGPTWLGFWDFCLHDPLPLTRSIVATHLLNPTFSHLNHIPPTQNQPPLPFVSENQVRTAQFPGFLTPRPPPAHAAQSQPPTHSTSPFPTSTTFPLCKNDPHRHSLVKTESSFWAFLFPGPPARATRP